MVATIPSERRILLEGPDRTSRNGNIDVSTASDQMAQSEEYEHYLALSSALSQASFSTMMSRYAAFASDLAEDRDLRTQGALVQSRMARVNAAKVQRNESALSLLAKLYENRVLNFSELGTDCTWLEASALAQLAGALLCDVDQSSVRITDSGISLVQQLIDLANS